MSSKICMNMVRLFLVRRDFRLISFIVNPKNGRPASMISQETYKTVRDNAELLDSTIIYNCDFNYNL
jgi:hypothetical protein